MLLQTISAKVTTTIAALAIGAAGAAVTTLALQGDDAAALTSASTSTTAGTPARATTAPTDDPTSDSPFGGRFGGHFGDRFGDLRDRLADLPQAFKDDIAAAFELDDADARRDALLAIKDKALAGDYGTDVQDKATKLRSTVEDHLADLPQALQDDLAAAWKLDDADARRDAFEAIKDNALAGDYGQDVQDRATDLQDRFADLKDRFPGLGSHHGGSGGFGGFGSHRGGPFR